MLAGFSLFWITCAFIGGIVFGNCFGLAFEILAGGAVVVLLLALFFRRKKSAFGLLILLSTFFLAGAYTTSFREVLAGTLPKYNIFVETPVTLEGVISSEITERKNGSRIKRNFEMDVSQIKMGGTWQKARAKILVNFYAPVPLQTGDRICTSGKLTRPFEYSHRPRFSYRDYLERQGIHWVFNISKNNEVKILGHNPGNQIYYRLLSLRDRLQRILGKYLPNEEAAIMETMLLGTRNRIPQVIQNLFIQTGTVHILAISGLHVTLMALLIFILLKIFPIGRRMQYLLTVGLLLGYTVLVGARPSVVRACLMSSVFLLSYLFERESDSLNSLSLSALLILLFNPFTLFDVGFQLSFVCVFGIIVIYPILWQQMEEHICFQNRWLQDQMQTLILSLAVWLAVVGFIVYAFGLIAPVTILANLIAVPLSSGVLILGTGLLLAGLFCPFLAMAFASCLQFALNIMVAVIYGFAKLPWAYFYVSEIPLLGVVIYYFVLWGVCFLARKQTPVNPGLLASLSAGETQALH